MGGSARNGRQKGSGAGGCRPKKEERHPSPDQDPPPDATEAPETDFEGQDQALTDERGGSQSMATEPDPGRREEAQERWFTAPEPRPGSGRKRKKKVSPPEELSLAVAKGMVRADQRKRRRGLGRLPRTLYSHSEWQMSWRWRICCRKDRSPSREDRPAPWPLPSSLPQRRGLR